MARSSVILASDWGMSKAAPAWHLCEHWIPLTPAADDKVEQSKCTLSQTMPGSFSQ